MSFDKKAYEQNDAKGRDFIKKVLEDLGFQPAVKGSVPPLAYKENLDKTREQLKAERDMIIPKKPDFILSLEGGRASCGLEVQIRQAWKADSQYDFEDIKVMTYPVRRNPYRLLPYPTLIVTLRGDLMNSYAYWLQDVDPTRVCTLPTKRSPNEPFVIVPKFQTALNWKNIEYLSGYTKFKKEA